jgi:DNA-directed RNA polymerase subunit M/transcription elongation factor TFIIS
MVPKNVGSKTILVCRGCGHEKKKVSVREYKITEESKNRRGDVPVVEEETKTDVEDQRRYMEDLYGFGSESDSDD